MFKGIHVCKIEEGKWDVYEVPRKEEELKAEKSS